MEVDKKKIIREAMAAYEKEIQMAINELIYIYRQVTDEGFFLQTKPAEETFLEEKHKKILNLIGGLVDFGLKIAEKEGIDLLYDQEDFTEDEIRDFIIKYAQDKYPEEFMKLKLEKDEKDKKFYEENKKKFEEIKKKRKPSEIEELLYLGLGPGSQYTAISFDDLDSEEYTMFLDRFNRYYFIREFLQTIIEYHNILNKMKQFGLDNQDTGIKNKIDTQFSVLPYLCQNIEFLKSDEAFITLLPLNIEKVIANEYSPEKIRLTIKGGENEIVEFKETLKTDIKIGKESELVEESALKTIAAFINTNGGLLLIGVKDNGEVIGINNYEGLENEDKYKRTLCNKIRDKVDITYSSLIRSRFTELDKKKVLVIDCCSNMRPEKPIFLKNDKYGVYIRNGA